MKLKYKVKPPIRNFTIEMYRPLTVPTPNSVTVLRSATEDQYLINDIDPTSTITYNTTTIPYTVTTTSTKNDSLSPL